MQMHTGILKYVNCPPMVIAVVMVLISDKTRDLTLAAIARNIVMKAAQLDIFLKTVHIMRV